MNDVEWQNISSVLRELSKNELLAVFAYVSVFLTPAQMSVAIEKSHEFPHNPENEPQCAGSGIKCVCWDIAHS